MRVHRESGEVYFWDWYAPKGKSIFKAADSFDEFCEGLTDLEPPE